MSFCPRKEWQRLLFTSHMQLPLPVVGYGESGSPFPEAARKSPRGNESRREWRMSLA